jgi:integrase
MARVNQRLWKIPGQRTKRKAWGFTAQINGKQVRRYKAEWTQDDAEAELAKALLKIEPEKPKGGGMTFGQAVEEYCRAKARKKSLAFDKLYLAELKAAFGADTHLIEITAARINHWKNEKLAAKCERTGRPYSAAAINRPLAVLRHLLQLAYEQQWAPLPSVPKIRLEEEPEGRIVWLEPDEEQRLLDACRASRTPELATIVQIALETGLRKGELIGLTWEQIDLSRGVIRLEGRATGKAGGTKSGRRREVPMRQVVYDLLAAMPEPRRGRVWKQRGIRTAFENAVAAAKLDRLDGDFTLHGCRHHFASWFVMRGGSLPVLQQILGHADIKMTLRYAHLAPHYLRQEVARTERPAQKIETATPSAQASAQEAGSAVQYVEGAA